MLSSICSVFGGIGVVVGVVGVGASVAAGVGASAVVVAAAVRYSRLSVRWVPSR